AAHRGAIRAKGKTIAVLGTGIDTVYPKENARLVEEILASGGAIVSQFPLETPPLSENFPYRNRIISGLSLGVLIVEASERSGSLITARLAMEQNREVLAVPGNVTSKNSFGTNYLIKSGAKLVQQWQDVVAELPGEIAAEILPPQIDKATGETNQQKSPPADLTENERTIYALLSPDEPVHIDSLLETSQLSIGDLASAMLGLEMRDLIKELAGKRYARKI
ncbi:MAG: DNA-processing protein DprA, partial [Pyrinomonadaceae bacterium]